jgi:hypothetical protein
MSPGSFRLLTESTQAILSRRDSHFHFFRCLLEPRILSSDFVAVRMGRVASLMKSGMTV